MAGKWHFGSALAKYTLHESATKIGATEEFRQLNAKAGSAFMLKMMFVSG
jgi:hypothetical protein